jgi:hypothetical protein
MPIFKWLLNADPRQKVEQFKPTYCDSWPRSVKGFGDALRRAAPALRQLGYELKSLGKVGGTVRYSAGKVLKQCPASPASPAYFDGEQDIRTFRTSNQILSPVDATSESFL